MAGKCARAETESGEHAGMSNDFSLARPPYSTVYLLLLDSDFSDGRSGVYTFRLSRFRTSVKRYRLTIPESGIYARPRAACRAGYALSWAIVKAIVILLLFYC